MKSWADIRDSASRSSGSMPSPHLIWAAAGHASSSVRRRMTNRGIERVPSPLRTPQPPRRPAGWLGDRKKVTLAEVGVAPSLEFLVVAPERKLLGEIGDDRLVVG